MRKFFVICAFSSFSLSLSVTSTTLLWIRRAKTYENSKYWRLQQGFDISSKIFTSFLVLESSANFIRSTKNSQSDRCDGCAYGCHLYFIVQRIADFITNYPVCRELFDDITLGEHDSLIRRQHRVIQQHRQRMKQNFTMIFTATTVKQCKLITRLHGFHFLPDSEPKLRINYHRRWVPLTNLLELDYELLLPLFISTSFFSVRCRDTYSYLKW